MDVKSLKNHVRAYLRGCADDGRKMATIYTSAILAAGFLTALLSVVTGYLIDRTGGLSDLGTRTMLGTLSSTVSVFVQILLPFWTMGLVSCALQFAREQIPAPRVLLSGFRRWGVILRLLLCMVLLLFLVSYILLQIATPLYMLTSAGKKTASLFESMLTDPAAVIGAPLEDTLLRAVAPLMIVWLGVTAAVAIPLFYRFRLSIYAVMDEPHPGAIRAMAQSARLMRGYRRKMLLLDLSFWWYYALQLLLSAIVWTPELLSALGIRAALSDDVIYLICYLVYGALTLLLHRRCLIYVESAYARFYDLRLRDMPVPAQGGLQPPL